MCVNSFVRFLYLFSVFANGLACVTESDGCHSSLRFDRMYRVFNCQYLCKCAHVSIALNIIIMRNDGE